MKTNIFIFLTFFVLSSENYASLKILHYNIKELDSQKIAKGHEQIDNLKLVLKNLPFDLMSVNEIQYDLPMVPTASFNSKGENLNFLKNIIGKEDYFSILSPSNTGQLAIPLSSGEYINSSMTSKILDHADHINYGLFPAQYSMGMLSKFEVKSVKIIKDIKWLDFNPERDFSSFTTANGDTYKSDLQLFDKSFVDVTISYEDKDLHIILLHTVPAFSFGHEQSINSIRNADQLRFLEWYLTGRTDIKVNLQNIKPLKKNDHYMAMGDWNVDVNKDEHEGSQVLKNLFKKVVVSTDLTKVSYVGQSFNETAERNLLDYIILSKHFKVLKSIIYFPDAKREDLGCGQININSLNLKGKELIKYKKQSQNCYALISKEYYQVKKTSDHLPLYIEIDLK